MISEWKRHAGSDRQWWDADPERCETRTRARRPINQVRWPSAGVNAISSSSGVTIATGSKLDVQANESVGSLSGNGSITDSIAGTTPTFVVTHGGSFSGVIADGSGELNLTVNGGTLTLSGANTYTGATTIQSGTLALAAINAISSSAGVAISTGATLDVQANENIGSLSGDWTITDSAVGIHIRR